MIPALLVTEGPKRGVQIEIPPNREFWIGRVKSSDFVLSEGNGVSRKHCSLFYDSKELVIKDDSTNGILLNGFKIHHQTATLKNTDIFCVGNYSFQVMDLEFDKRELEENEISTLLETLKDQEEDSSSKRPFKKVGPYIHLHKIGSGALSTVYKTIDENLKKYVALKVFPNLEELGADIASRFRREIKILSSLKHENIVEIYDSGSFSLQDERVVNYIALEFFQGSNLRDYVDIYGPMPFEKVFPILYQLLQALCYTHSKGVVHRDIKPANILYNKFQKSVKIVDLGLGKCLSQEEREATFTTSPNSSLGTPYFMPIEQWKNAKNVDLRADIYSLGATIYFVLTGKVPFKNNENNLIEILSSIVKQSLVPIEQLNPSIPKSFLAFIYKMMAFNKKDRYPDSNIALEKLKDLAKELGYSLEE